MKSILQKHAACFFKKKAGKKHCSQVKTEA